jgi:hypothetical protein
MMRPTESKTRSAALVALLAGALLVVLSQATGGFGGSRARSRAGSIRATAAVPRTGRGRVLFNGTTLAGWINQSASPTRVQEVPDPSGARGAVLQLTAKNGDIAPLTPTDNPRAQLITPNNIVKAGVPFWESYEVYVPMSFSITESDGGWLALGSPFYGPPYNGTPSIELIIANGHYYWSTDPSGPAGSRLLWSSRVAFGKWTRFTWHVVPATRGFAELYVNDRPIRVTYDGRTGDGVRIPVIDATNYKGPWFSQLSVYYEHNAYPSLTVDFKNFRIGTTEAAARGF